MIDFYLQNDLCCPVTGSIVNFRLCDIFFLYIKSDEYKKAMHNRVNFVTIMTGTLKLHNKLCNDFMYLSFNVFVPCSCS